MINKPICEPSVIFYDSPIKSLADKLKDILKNTNIAYVRWFQYTELDENNDNERSFYVSSPEFYTPTNRLLEDVDETVKEEINYLLDEAPELTPLYTSDTSLITAIEFNTKHGILVVYFAEKSNFEFNKKDEEKKEIKNETE